mmetsp:Transcript_36364/g.50521  ORF Transcript_36364/g.50521 Transcript_36364/m.50521 type:complete len:155 (+) Transcript_36364:133-597(+)|eukprot:CAMPEP_0196587848 /NCGR_PEP_ID=MMETSP1081-20130531/58791_1 /TAXON_ID=36882 /ORGANISM="Pyramimonas amylifera, Strain CCMP720" /LENGTH=154 /DNA_ID=CAMNT_0041910153 /DNA_START=125 /DNA_END=589 /DNA_ORIENTATION=-
MFSFDETGLKNRVIQKNLPGDNELRDILKYFEERVDMDDLEQATILEVMREDTRRLEQDRGVWSKRGAPGGKGDWNDFELPKVSPTPLDCEEFREYKEHTQGGGARADNVRQISNSSHNDKPTVFKGNEDANKEINAKKAECRMDFLKSRGLVF